MNENNLEQLKKIVTALSPDNVVITTKELDQLFAGIVGILASHKKSTEALNQETKDLIENVMGNVESRHLKTLLELGENNKNSKNDLMTEFAEKIEQVRQIVKDFETTKPQDGISPDKNEIIQEVLAQIKLPEYEKVTLDTADQMVAKINSLDTKDPECQIDFSHIKNVPDFGEIVRKENKMLVGGRIFAQMADVSFTNLQNGDFVVWDATNLRFKNSAGGGSSGITSINGDTTAGQTIVAASSGTDFTISTASGVTTIAIPTASASNRGLLSSADWSTFNGKQGAITLTTTGTSGAATFIGGTLNIPQYAGATYIAGTGLTLTGSTFSVNTSQNIATLSNLTGNGLIKTSGGTGLLSIATAGTDYQAPIALTTTGTSGAATFISNTLNIPNYTYTLPTASTSVLGGVKVDGTSITISGGVISAAGGGGGTVTSVTSADANATVANTTTTPVITIVAAPKLQTARTISITGDLAYTSPSFDGTGNVTAGGTLATVNTNTGSWGTATQSPQFTVNGKGLITAVTNVTITPAVGSITGLATGMATFLATPTSANLAATVTDETGSGALVFGTSPIITLASASTAVTQSPNNNSTAIATTAYVDNAFASFDTKRDVAYASTSALPANTYANGSSGVGATLTGNSNGPLIIDGVTILVAQAGEDVLIAGEATSANNGWYTITQVGVVAVSPYILTRRVTDDQAAEIGSGYLTSVIAPNGVTVGANNGKVFISIAAANPFVVGTTNLTFSAVGSVYFAGNGLSLSGTTFSIDTTITVDKTTAQALTNKNLTSGTNTFPTFNQNTTGSAATLTTPRAINGVNFDGSAAITVTAAAGTLTGTTLNSTVVSSSLTSVGTLATLTVTGNITNSVLTASKVVFTDASKNLTSTGIGTSAQFIKGDGSLDSSTYLTSAGAVTSITGTANQVIASASTGAVTLSLPQSIATTSTPQFAKIGLGAAADANRLLYVTGDVSGGTATIERTNATTSAVVGTSIIKGRSTGGAATSGFGTAFQFALGDTVTSEVITGSIRMFLSGGSLASSPSVDMDFNTMNSGVITNSLSIKADGRINLTQPVYGSGSDSLLVVTGGAHTGQTASTEETDINFNLARTVQFATGALTTQRAFRIQAPTYGFVGASTITKAATLSISGAPVAGTNATITSSYALWVEAGKAQFDGGITTTNVNGNTITTGTGTLTIAAGKTLTANNSIALTGTDSTTMTFPTTSKTIAANDGSNWTLASQTTGDIMYAGSSTTMSRLAAVATAGKVLQSGASAAPTWSTPTYPSASGTARKILVSDGTNNVYSTETYAVPSTSGNVLTSDGTNWISSAPTGSSVTFTSGTANVPGTSSTQTVTHSLGRIPKNITLQAIGKFAGTTSGTQSPISWGTWNSSGNNCLYVPQAAPIGTASTPQTSATFAIYADAGNGGGTNSATGVVGNVTSTSFDIVWTWTNPTTSGEIFLWTTT